MIRSALLAGVLALLCMLPGCKTNDQGELVPDWPVIAAELQLTADDLNAVAELVSDPEMADALREVARLSGEVASAIEAGGPPGEPLDALQAALALADSLVARLPADAQQDARVALFVAGVVVRRVKSYHGAP